MPRAFWSPDAGPVGNSLGLLNDAGQPPQRSTARLIDPSDVTYPAPGGGMLRVPVGGGAAAPINGSINGQLWYYNQTTGLWALTPAGPSNLQVPQWNAAQNRYDFTTLVSPGQLSYFDTRLAPVALYNGSVIDQSGNGFDLGVSGGTIGNANIYPGKIGRAHV